MAKKIAMAAWEIGHAETPWGIRVGGMGLVVEELPSEMLRYAKKNLQDIEVEVLSPCFRFYMRTPGKPESLQYEETIDVPRFNLKFDVFSHIYETTFGKVKHLYFWNDKVLGDFGDRNPNQSIYLSDPWKALIVQARVDAAMATYIMKHPYHAVQMHDYHVGLIPFYMDWQTLRQNPNNIPSLMFTIHNASYQGWLNLWGDPGPVMYEISMPNHWYHYFQYWGNFNTIKGIRLYLEDLHYQHITKVAITTVSENYAKELEYSENQIRREIQKKRLPQPQRVVVPNVHLSELGWCQPSIVGINNGLKESNHPSKTTLFQAYTLKQFQQRFGEVPVFQNSEVRSSLYGCNCSSNCEHNKNYSFENYSNRQELRRLMYLEFFGKTPAHNDIAFCFNGRLDPQKNLDVIYELIRQFSWEDYPNVYFIISTTPPPRGQGNPYADWVIDAIRNLARQFPKKVGLYDRFFNLPISKLIYAGSDFFFMPSRFEPCGLADYEASIMGCIPIVRETGGLKKTLPYSLSYAWYDDDDRTKEAWELMKVVDRAVGLFDLSEADLKELRTTENLSQVKDSEIVRRIHGCMNLDTSWDKAIQQYFRLLGI